MTNPANTFPMGAEGSESPPSSAPTLMGDSLTDRVVALFEEARRIEDQPPRPRFSNGADCLRMHTYAARDYAAGTWRPWRDRPVRWNMAAAFGTALGDMLEAAAKRLGARTQVGAVLVEDDVEVVGHLDIEWDSPPEVWDIKGISDYGWREVQKAPKERHVMQLCGYLAARKKPNGALLYVKQSSVGKGQHLEWIAHEVPADPELARELVNRWRKVKFHVASDTLPDRPFEKPDEFECRVCHYLHECWEMP